MALTRKLLEGMGLEEKQIGTIIDMHAEVVDRIKAELAEARSTADMVPELEKQLEEASKAAEDGAEWKAKYEEERESLKSYKATVDAERKEADKASKYRKMLGDAGIDPNRIDSIMRLVDLSKVEVDEGGELKGVDGLKEKAAEEWSDFILKKKVEGTDPANPPKSSNTGSGADPDILAQLQKRHERLYGKADKEKEQA